MIDIEGVSICDELRLLTEAQQLASLSRAVSGSWSPRSAAVLCALSQDIRALLSTNSAVQRDSLSATDSSTAVVAAGGTLPFTPGFLGSILPPCVELGLDSFQTYPRDFTLHLSVVVGFKIIPIFPFKACSDFFTP